MKTVKVNGTVYEIFLGKSCITYPQNICLQDSIDEMLEDIGEFNTKYLKEVYLNNISFYIT